jgi:predicted DCC family thiol-disulfide oxidoreductase YuxK
VDDQSIILFDGVCNLCNGFVNFLIPRDKNQRFIFGSLQSAAGSRLLKAHHFPTDKITTVVLIEKDRLFSESTAVLKIFRKMSGLWPLLYGLIIIPPFFRDYIYKLISKNRYRIFGKRDACMIPNPELAARFLAS